MNGKLSTGAAYGTSIATLYAGLTMNEWASIAGIIGVFGTLAIAFFFRWRDDRRKHEAHELYMERLRKCHDEQQLRKCHDEPDEF
jgi:hypothetical protein